MFIASRKSTTTQFKSDAEFGSRQAILAMAPWTVKGLARMEAMLREKSIRIATLEIVLCVLCRVSL